MSDSNRWENICYACEIMLKNDSCLILLCGDRLINEASEFVQHQDRFDDLPVQIGMLEGNIPSQSRLVHSKEKL